MEGNNKAAPDDIENPHIPLLATSIREELGNLSPLSSDCCIFRVPERQRHLNEKAYEPRVVSIGPLHHGKDGFRAMEEHKKRYLQYFLNRTRVSLENFLQKIRSQEEKIRSCYAETIKIESDEFVKIILMDATFILELLLRAYFKDYGQEADRIFENPNMINDIWPDMLLLENQLPFFILKDLWDLCNTEVSSYSRTKQVSIGDLLFGFFDCALDLGKAKERRFERARSSDAPVEHFVDFMRKLCLPCKSRGAGELNKLTTPSITYLYQAGVKFEMVPNETNIFDLDIQFTTDGVLRIPRITIGDATEVIMRNLVAFEQCNDGIGNHIADYVSMMDRFVNTSKDVDLLVESDIIENLMGDSTAVSTLINALGKGVNFDSSQFCYAAVCKDLNNYYNSTWHKWKANLRQNYFSTPWATISVIAAVFLIILTLIQTVCSIVSLI